MGVFDDKKFEQLDWMTQITETIDSELNEVLAKLPDRVEFTLKDILRRVMPYSYFTMRVDSLVRDILSETPSGQNLSWVESTQIVNCFRFDMSPDLELDLESNTMTGTLALVKTIPTLTDEDLQQIMGSRGLEAIKRIDFDAGEEWPLDRVNEMLDILGKCEEAKSNRSSRKKMRRLEERLKEIFASNEWRIRDMALADRVCIWIADYINTGNLAALTNFCKLKVMTHNNMPIYSVEEEK